METTLYIDVQNKELVKGLYDKSAFQLPALFHEDSFDLKIYLLQPTGDSAAPFSKVDIDALGMKVGIGSTDDLLTLQTTWTKDTSDDSFSGELELDTTEMVAAFSGKDTLNKIFEVEITNGAKRDTVLQIPVSLDKDIIREASLETTSYSPPSALHTNLMDVLQDSTTNDIVDAGSNKVEVRVIESGLSLGNIGGTLGVAKGGTGLSELGSAGTVLTVNSGGTAAEWGAAGGITSIDQVGDVSSGGAQSGDFLKFDGTNWANTTAEIDNLSDVDVSTSAPSDGYILKYSGTTSMWEPAALSAGTLDGLTDVSAAGASAGSIIYHDGSNWTLLSAETEGDLLYRDGSGLSVLGKGNSGEVLKSSSSSIEWGTVSGTGGDMLASNNLSDVSSASDARTNLGLGTIATQSADSPTIGTNSGTITMGASSNSGIININGLDWNVSTSSTALPTSGKKLLGYNADSPNGLELMDAPAPSGAADTEVIFNNSGTLDGDSNLTYAATSGVLKAKGHSFVKYTESDSSSITVDADNGTMQSLDSYSDIIFSQTNFVEGSTVSLRISNADSSDHTLTFDSSWAMLGSIDNTTDYTLAAGKVGVLSLTCYGSGGATDTVACFAAQK